MKIPEDVLKKWNNLRTYGDGVKIVEKNPELSPNDITRAFQEKECSDKVFVAMAGFYKEREEKVKEFL